MMYTSVLGNSVSNGMNVRAEAAAGDDRDVVTALGQALGDAQHRGKLTGDGRGRDDDLGHQCSPLGPMR
ncbi:MAG TPA: hypothetical protein VF444_21440 [Pseudonocardiaceae bacterium]